MAGSEGWAAYGAAVQDESGSAEKKVVPRDEREQTEGDPAHPGGCGRYVRGAGACPRMGTRDIQNSRTILMPNSVHSMARVLRWDSGLLSKNKLLL